MDVSYLKPALYNNLGIITWWTLNTILAVHTQIDFSAITIFCRFIVLLPNICCTAKNLQSIYWICSLEYEEACQSSVYKGCNNGSSCALFTGEFEEAARSWGRGGTSHNAVISRIIHTLRSKERPLSGWLYSWGLITSISTEAGCKWSLSDESEGAYHPDFSINI